MADPTISPSRQPQLILASSSRYRCALLERLQFDFTTHAPTIDETPRLAEGPQQTAMRLAQEKAEAVAAQCIDAVIIGSDQVALLDGEQIGKPGNHSAALMQLQKMQGRTVLFHTAVCLLDTREPPCAERLQLANIETAVSFRTLPTHQLDQYLRIEQPYDCAGSAKNEGLGIALIASIKSNDPTALTGLPLIALSTMLIKAGFNFFTNTAV